MGCFVGRSLALSLVAYTTSYAVYRLSQSIAQFFNKFKYARIYSFIYVLYITKKKSNSAILKHIGKHIVCSIVHSNIFLSTEIVK